jgi:hypothetical protein
MAELEPERGLSAALTRAATVLAFADEIRCDPDRPFALAPQGD